MIFRIKFPAAVICVLLASGSYIAEALDEQMTFVPWTGGNWKSAWPGVGQRTYFYQWSADLVTWHYAPFMAFGTGEHEYFMAASPAKLFVRLHRVDDPLVTTLLEAQNADLDGDGLSNLSEVSTYETFPTLWDTDGDLIPDGLEVEFHTSAISNHSAADDDSDGMNNAEEYLAGRDPALADPVSDTSSRSLAVFNLSPF